MISLHILQAQYTASVSDQSLVASMCDYYSNLTPTNMLPIYYKSIILSADEMFGMWLDDMLRHVREDWTQNLLSEDLVLFLETTWSLSSDFNQPDVEVFILLGHDTAVLGNQLLTFQGNKMVSSSGFEMSKKNTIEQVDAWLYWDSVISDWLTAPSPHSLTCWLHHSTHQHYCPCPPHFTLPHGMIPVWDHFRCLCLCVCVCVCVYICRKIGVWMCVCVCIYIYISRKMVLFPDIRHCVVSDVTYCLVWASLVVEALSRHLLWFLLFYMPSVLYCLVLLSL